MKSPISYLGGKSLLAKKIIPLIPKHHCFCEVFAGASWITFKKEPSKVEIINNINSDLTTLYRVIKLHLEEFIRYLKWLLVSRDEFNRFMAENPESLTDIQRAVRFYYLLKTGYASKVVGQTLSASTFRTSNFNLMRIEEELSDAHLRLHRVFVENKPYDKFIERYDKPHTFFYIDPPYYNCENDYGKGIFSKNDFNKLADILSKITGKFILSINDTQETREIFSGFQVKEVDTTYSVASTEKKKVKELLFFNFNI